jgi:hypothetical protein
MRGLTILESSGFLILGSVAIFHPRKYASYLASRGSVNGDSISISSLS